MDTYAYQPHKTSMFKNFDANWMAVIVYVGYIVLYLIPGVSSVAGMLAWILPLVVLFVERDSGLVRYSAAQSLVLSLAQLLINLILTIFGAVTLGIGFIITAPLMVVVNIVVFVLEVICAVRAYQWTALRIPLVGNWAARVETRIKPA